MPRNPEAFVIDTLKIPTVGLGANRSPKHRSGSKAASSSSKRRAALSGLSPTELLAKIDALDWDDTLSADTTVLAEEAEKHTQYPDHSTSAWRVAAIVATLVAVFAVLYVFLTPDTGSRATEVAQAQTAEAAPLPIPAPAPIEAPKAEAPPLAAAPEPEPDPVAAEADVVEEAQPAPAAQTADDAAKKAQRKAERQRKAREAELARQEQQERERRQQQEAQQRADREAAEAAARAAKARELAAAPKAPASPQELCAGEGNFFARGLCETRTCGKAEWRNHPFCVKRIEDSLRSISPGSN